MEALETRTSIFRIQMRRTPGWKKPEDAIFVGGRSRWANPFETPATFACWLQRIRDGNALPAPPSQSMLRYPMRDPLGHMVRIVEELDSLWGMRLACWCPLDRACHADVLAKAANPNNVIPIEGPIFLEWADSWLRSR